MIKEFNLIPICIFIGISVFLLILLIFSSPQRTRREKAKKEKTNEWLYNNLLEKLYDALFGNYDPAVLSKKLGLEYDKYMINCRVIDKAPNLKKETMLRIIGLIAFFGGTILSLVLWSFIPAIIGMVTYLLCVTRVTTAVKTAAEIKKSQVLSDLPRFVDLLQAALEVGLPIDVAIQETANDIPGTISTDLKTSIAEMEIGAENWQSALESIAHKYELDILSDFVLDIITSYNKGVSVTNAVARKAYEVKQSALLRAKEQTAKMSSTILMPIVIFKIAPLLVIMMVPIIMQITSVFMGR